MLNGWKLIGLESVGREVQRARICRSWASRTDKNRRGSQFAALDETIDSKQRFNPEGEFERGENKHDVNCRSGVNIAKSSKLPQDNCLQFIQFTYPLYNLSRQSQSDFMKLFAATEGLLRTQAAALPNLGITSAQLRHNYSLGCTNTPIPLWTRAAVLAGRSIN
jgi:hypothetical protein